MADTSASAATPAVASPLDARFEKLVADRFAELIERRPLLATFLGLHEHDHRLPDGTREGVLEDASSARRFASALASIDPAALSPANQVERELALLVARRELFDIEVHRLWERRLSAADQIGEGIFILFAREARPLTERLEAICSRLEQASRLIVEQRSRLGERPVRLWNELEIDAAGSLPVLFDEVVDAARAGLGDEAPLTARLARATKAAAAALDEHGQWLRHQLGRAVDDFALGKEDYATLIDLRAFDGLDADHILDIGLEQLAEQRQARRGAAAEIDPHADEREVVDRVKSNHPADFEQALGAYRQAMQEARAFVIDREIATMPAGERLSVVATPEFMRRVLPFAAYLTPPKFAEAREGVYMVTPSVDGDPRAMREHNYASIYNTGIHEAYPGHHQQLTAALDHPSLTRLIMDSPEFVEGWAMYCEQMMREQGFDTAPESRLTMHTDAIWRACRIILDVRLHRREISLADGVEFLIEQTGFERPQATAEVQNYTASPTYYLSYSLGKMLLLRLRADEQRRLGEAFSLRDFHDALLREGSIPISFHRRLMAGQPTGAN